METLIDHLSNSLESTSRYLKYVGFAIIFSWPLILKGKENEKRNSEDLLEEFSKKSAISLWIPRMIVVLIGFLFSAYRFVVLPLPQGNDTPVYIYYLLKMDTASSILQILEEVRTRHLFITSIFDLLSAPRST